MVRRCGSDARMSWVSRWSSGSWGSNSCTTSPISARARAAIMRTMSSTVIACRSDHPGMPILPRDYISGVGYQWIGTADVMLCAFCSHSRDLPMPRENSDSSNDWNQRQRALSRWDNEGGAGPDGPATVSAPDSERIAIPELTNAELVTLRIRVIALENLMISLLARASDEQLKLAREMAGYISPRPGFTQHPLTIHAAAHMVDLVERADHFRDFEF